MPKINEPSTHKAVQPHDHVYETFESLTQLVHGAQHRRAKTLQDPSQRDLHDQLSKGQSPPTYVFCCSDSRYAPTKAFNSPLGELFEHRNVGNMTPLSDQSVRAGIRFALNSLKVRHIIVLGHTGCGAMTGALALNTLNDTELGPWLNHTQGLLKRLDKHFPHVTDPKEKAMAASQENVLMQIERLHEHPDVKERVAKEELAVFGFIYDIYNHGALSGWDPKRGKFVPINASDTPLPERRS